jgi:hypothetical protein
LLWLSALLAVICLASYFLFGSVENLAVGRQQADQQARHCHLQLVAYEMPVSSYRRGVFGAHTFPPIRRSVMGSADEDRAEAAKYPAGDLLAILYMQHAQVTDLMEQITEA